MSAYASFASERPLTLRDYSLFCWSPILLVGLFVSLLLRRWLRLAHIPGPFMARFTNLSAAVQLRKGLCWHEYIADLHQQYGPVVRWGPNRVSFADPAAINCILGTKSVYSKSSGYDPMVVVAENGREVTSLITIRDEARLTAIKRHISAGFSQSTWLKQENQIDGKLKKLIVQCLQDRCGKTTIPLHEWLSFWAFDTITQLAFSDDRDYLTHGEDLDGLFPAVAGRFRHWGQWVATPDLEKLFYKNRFVRSVSRPSPLVQLAHSRIQDRKENPTDSPTGIEFDLMGRYLAASQKAPDVISPQDVLALTVSTLNAGSETVSTATSAVFCHLLTHPEGYSRLEAEILAANLPFPPPFRDIDGLPFLDAAIRESMRLSHQSPNPKERTVGPTSAMICNTYIPAGTDVAVSSISTSLDSATYGDAAESFIPERWIGIEESQWRAMDHAALAFSYGRRVCTGMHLARIEMKKVIVSLILRFKIELVGEVRTGFENNTKFAHLSVRLTARQ